MAFLFGYAPAQGHDIMAYIAPHFGNLKARATALGLIITKTSTAEDARNYGGHSYVLHAPGANWENMTTLALGGIRAEIEEIEKKAAERAAKIERIAQAKAAHNIAHFGDDRKSAIDYVETERAQESYIGHNTQNVDVIRECNLQIEICTRALEIINATPVSVPSLFSAESLAELAAIEGVTIVDMGNPAEMHNALAAALNEPATAIPPLFPNDDLTFIPNFPDRVLPADDRPIFFRDWAQAVDCLDEANVFAGLQDGSIMVADLSALETRNRAYAKATYDALKEDRDGFVIGAPDGTETPAPEQWERENEDDARLLAELQEVFEPKSE